MNHALHVLVADDDPAVRSFLGACLTTLGHQATLVESAERLIDVCRELEPDVVVSDVDMPGMSGVDAVLTIRGFSSVPILLLSGHWSAEHLDRIEAIPRLHYESKPIRCTELATAIQHSLRL